MKFSNLVNGMSPNILSVLEERRRALAESGMEIINLSAGTPDLPPDSFVMETLAREAMDPKNYKYAIFDFPELLECAAGWYQRRFDVGLEPDQVTSLYGSQEGLGHICFPLCNPGDIVFMPDPCYPVFEFGPKMAGAVPYLLPLKEENAFLIDFDGIPASVAHRAKLLILSYPNNPTTATAPPEFYERLVHFAKKYDIAVLHDNAYAELVLDGEPGGSFLQAKGALDVGVEVNSLSKSYNLTGMRASFALGNKDIIQALRKVRSQIDYGPFPAIQKTVMAVLNGPQDILQRNRDAYRQRRDVFCNGLRRAGWQVPDSHSTMFVWAPLPGGRTDDQAFVFELMDQTGIIGVPGSTFGKSGNGFVRFALIQPAEKLEQVVQKIANSGLI